MASGRGVGIGLTGVWRGTTLIGTSKVISGLVLTLGLSFFGVSVILGASNLGISRVGIPELPPFVLVGWVITSIFGFSICTSVFGVLNVTSILGMTIGST